MIEIEQEVYPIAEVVAELNGKCPHCGCKLDSEKYNIEISGLKANRQFYDKNKPKPHVYPSHFTGKSAMLGNNSVDKLWSQIVDRLQ